MNQVFLYILYTRYYIHIHKNMGYFWNMDSKHQNNNIHYD